MPTGDLRRRAEGGASIVVRFASSGLDYFFLRTAFFFAGVFRFGAFFFPAAVFFFGAAARSGSFALPVSRFHSSNVSGLILPSTSSCANFRRWAWLLNGMQISASATDNAVASRWTSSGTHFGN